MSRGTFEQYRLPLAAVLVLMAAVLLLPRGGPEAGPSPTPVPSIVVGEPGGAVIATPTIRPTRSPIPTVAAAPTAEPTVAPTPVAGDGGFSAEVLACRSISGSTCNDQLGSLPPSAGSMTALVRFTAASAGDTMNAILSGPSGRIDGFPYTLGGGGDGYYYTTFTMSGLPAGDYTLTATRNGQPVATTTFRKVGR